MLFIGGLL